VKTEKVYLGETISNKYGNGILKVKMNMMSPEFLKVLIEEK
jgi:hypothetical protein